MIIPYLQLREGDEAFVRSVVLEASSDCFKVEMQDYPKYIFTTYTPVSEVAKAEHIHLLSPMRRMRQAVNPRFYE